MITIAKLGDYLDLITYGFTNPMPDSDDGPWKITAKDIVGGKINYSTARKTTKTAFDHELSNKSRPKIGDVLLTKDGTLGRLAIVREGNLCVSQSVAVLRPNRKLLPDYLYYLLASTKYQHKLLADSDGSVLKHIYITRVPEMDVEVPPLPWQHAAVHILQSLDNKIQLNRQTNESLEKMAQALFKSWFVDFDPVIDNALDAGNTIPDELQERAQRRQQQLAKPDHQPLPDDIRQLFPSEFELTEELGWVPMGWTVKDMTQLLDTVSNTYPLKSVEKVIFLNTGDVEAGVFLHSDYSDTGSLPGQAKKSIQPNDILYSEIRPKNRRFAYVNFESGQYVVSTKLMVLRSKGVVDSKFAYFVLTLDSNIKELQSIAEIRSGTFPQITFKELSNIRIPIPDQHSVLDVFSELILDKYYEKHFQFQAQNAELKKLRDTLLPKLISGELRLPSDASADAEQQSADSTS
jgi:type I restriction enzyme S subunit